MIDDAVLAPGFGDSLRSRCGEAGVVGFGVLDKLFFVVGEL